MTYVVVSIAVVETFIVERILRIQSALVGVEVIGEQTRVGNDIQCVAVGVVRLELQRRETALQAHGDAVIVADVAAVDLGDRAEARIRSPRHSWQVGKLAASCSEAAEARHIAVRIQTAILQRPVDLMIAYVVNAQRSLLTESLLHFQVPLLVLRSVNRTCRVEQRGWHEEWVRCLNAGQSTATPETRDKCRIGTGCLRLDITRKTWR